MFHSLLWRRQSSHEAASDSPDNSPKYPSEDRPGLSIWIHLTVWPLLASFTGVTLLLFGLRAAPLPEESLSNPTEIESSDGGRIATWSIAGSGTHHVTARDVPERLEQATIAVEDANFYRHRAFSIPSMVRATLVDMRHGRVVEGGSTITQQLAKNLFLSPHRTLARKIREALYAIQLEIHESKDTILLQYLNVVYYGQGAYGVGSASEVYFGKPVRELDLAECAMLAGLTKGPSLYSPLTHYRLAKERQQIVLDRMVQCGYISPTEADAAYREPLHFVKNHPPLEVAPYFTSTVMDELSRRYHLHSEELLQGGATVVTTLDNLLQNAAERAIVSTLPKNSSIQAALVAIDPKTGAIRAMVGGRNFQHSPYNRVLAERQPGSTFKALLYTAALLHHWSPAREVNSQLTTFVRGDRNQRNLYTVHDYGDFYAGRPITLREAIARSDNVYAVTTNVLVGPKTVAETAHAMGITSPLDAYPSLALGVSPTSPLQMATAYATLANGGIRVTPYTVEEIRSEWRPRDVRAEHITAPVLSPQVAFQVTDLLRSVLEPHGTGYGVHNYLHTMAAAKTGTTDTDAWMVGYTPSLVCAVWVGYDNNQPLTVSESHLAAPIWAKFMGTAQDHLPTPWYKPPSGLVQRTVDPLTGALATNLCRTTETDYFQPGSEPVESCPLHQPAPGPMHRLNGLWPWVRHLFGG